ncbi:hypothetical protein [Leeuwenhoekiella sp. MAR_2009_132]|uniref:hypothetical protein n=1 Tax=Leeuwenhoekiella sp. MAR_2009_132 TaxID=1392489 RepID=UPI00048E0579|nr:hypothetical protein [Leeuwenhoekiella sp. MAR_2009_132]
MVLFQNSVININLFDKLVIWQELYIKVFIKVLIKTFKVNNKFRENLAEEATVSSSAVENRSTSTLAQLRDENYAFNKNDEFEWMSLIEENKKKAQDLQNQINQTECKIDQMVYELYGLTEEEVAIVESS